MEHSRPNPIRLAVQVIAGALLIMSVWFLTFLPVPRYATGGAGLWPLLWAARWQALLLITPLVAGLVVMLRAERVFKRAYRDGVWTGPELDPVRALLSRPVWKWMSGGALVLALCSIVFRSHGLSGNGGFIYLLILPLSTVTNLLKAITPSTPGKAVCATGRTSSPFNPTIGVLLYSMGTMIGCPRRDAYGLAVRSMKPYTYGRR